MRYVVILILLACFGLIAHWAYGRPQIAAPVVFLDGQPYWPGCPAIYPGALYECRLNITGGVKPYHCSITGGSLYPGLNIFDENGTCVIRGTPGIGPLPPTNLQILVAKFREMIR